MNNSETTYSNNIKIKFLEQQICENDWKGSTGSSFDKKWWYSKANESLEARMSLYK